MNKKKISFEQISNESKDEHSRICTIISDDNTFLHFNYNVDVNNKMEIIYDKKANELILIKEGQINYNIKHQVDVESLEEIYIFNDKILKNIKTIEIKYIDKTNTENYQQINMKYLLDNELIKIKLKLEG